MKKLCISCHEVAVFSCSHFYVCADTECGRRIQNVIGETLSIGGKRKFANFDDHDVKYIVGFLEIMSVLFAENASNIALLRDPGTELAFINKDLAILLDKTIVRVDYPYDKTKHRFVHLSGQGLYEIRLLSSLQLFSDLGVSLEDVIKNIFRILNHAAKGKDPIEAFVLQGEALDEWRKLAKPSIAFQLLHFFIRSADMLAEEELKSIWSRLGDVFKKSLRPLRGQEIFDFRYRLSVYTALLVEEFETRISKVYPDLERPFQMQMFPIIGSVPYLSLFKVPAIVKTIKTNRLLPLLFLMEYHILGPKLSHAFRTRYYVTHTNTLHSLFENKEKLSASQSVPWDVYPIIYSLQANLNLNVLQPKLTAPLFVEYQQLLLETSPDLVFPMFVYMLIGQSQLMAEAYPPLDMPLDKLRERIGIQTLRIRLDILDTNNLFVFCSSAFLLNQNAEILNLLVYALRRERVKISILNDKIRLKKLDVLQEHRDIIGILRRYMYENPMFSRHLENTIFTKPFNLKVHNVLMELENKLAQVVQSVEIFTGQHYNYVSKANVWKVYNDALEAAEKKQKT